MKLEVEYSGNGDRVGSGPPAGTQITLQPWIAMDDSKLSQQSIVISGSASFPDSLNSPVLRLSGLSLAHAELRFSNTGDARLSVRFYMGVSKLGWNFVL